MKMKKKVVTPFTTTGEGRVALFDALISAVAHHEFISIAWETERVGSEQLGKRINEEGIMGTTTFPAQPIEVVSSLFGLHLEQVFYPSDKADTIVGIIR